MNRSIQHEYFFAQSPVTVWEYLTNPDLMTLWLMKNNFTPEVGAEFQFTTKPIPSLDFDGIFYCKVLELVPHKKLSYSWKSGPGDKKITLDSVVRWTLEPANGGTKVLLDHSGFEKDDNLAMYNGLLQGWLEKFAKIEKLINEEAHVRTKA
ncbi:MAG TPA: SRPBCC domain-containing protein [Chitinophagaceae bacterium]|nr:SRPBCC domain-containing protein [Chitinophagaceae bacterium]